MKRAFAPLVILAGLLVFTTSGAVAKTNSCPAPCYGASIDNVPKWPQPGGTTTVTLDVFGSGVKTLTVTEKKLNPLMKLVKKGSTSYSVVGGTPTWTLKNVGTRSLHFKLLVSKTAKRGKMLTVTVHLSGVADKWTKAGDLPLGIYVATKPAV